MAFVKQSYQRQTYKQEDTRKDNTHIVTKTHKETKDAGKILLEHGALGFAGMRSVDVDRVGRGAVGKPGVRSDNWNVEW